MMHEQDELVSRSEVQEMIKQSISIAIKNHEIRVGWISGIIGALFVFGIIHSIWLIKNLIR
jgi:hypothetical protein